MASSVTTVRFAFPRPRVPSAQRLAISARMSASIRVVVRICSRAGRAGSPARSGSGWGTGAGPDGAGRIIRSVGGGGGAGTTPGAGGAGGRHSSLVLRGAGLAGTGEKLGAGVAATGRGEGVEGAIPSSAYGSRALRYSVIGRSFRRCSRRGRTPRDRSHTRGRPG